MSRDARSVQRRLGGRIQVLRRERGMTQDELAHAAGISQKYLSELERGAKAPSLETLVALAHNGFAIRIAELLFGVDEDVPKEIATLEELLAGRAHADRSRILSAVGLLLEYRVPAPPRGGVSLAAEARTRPRHR